MHLDLISADHDLYIFDLYIRIVISLLTEGSQSNKQPECLRGSYAYFCSYGGDDDDNDDDDDDIKDYLLLMGTWY